MHHVKEKRKQQRAITLSEAATICNMSVGSLQWHRMKGRIPQGEIVIDQHRFFSPRQLEEVKRFFSERAKFQHMK